MAKKQGGRARQDWEVDFLFVEMDKGQREQLQRWDLGGELSFQEISNHVLAGCKFSLVSDTRNDCCIASLTGPKVAGGGRQVCISGRGPGVEEAIRSLAYKIIYILDGEMENAREISQARDSWG